jgi:hypothetical protein
MRTGDWIRALEIVEHDGRPLIISAGDDMLIIAHALSGFDDRFAAAGDLERVNARSQPG